MMLALLAVPGLAATFPGPDAQWEQLSGGDPRIECTTVDGSPWCRSTGVVAAPPQQVSDTLEHMADHQDLFTSIVRIDVLAPDTMHVVLDFPSGMSDRDYVGKYTRLTDGDTEVYRWVPVTDAKAPAEDGVVRLPDMAGEWRIAPAANGQSQVTYVWEADILGSFPSFLLNKARNIAGQKALEDIRKATAAAATKP